MWITSALWHFIQWVIDRKGQDFKNIFKIILRNLTDLIDPWMAHCTALSSVVDTAENTIIFTSKSVQRTPNQNDSEENAPQAKNWTTCRQLIARSARNIRPTFKARSPTIVDCTNSGMKRDTKSTAMLPCSCQTGQTRSEKWTRKVNSEDYRIEFWNSQMPFYPRFSTQPTPEILQSEKIICYPPYQEITASWLWRCNLKIHF